MRVLVFGGAGMLGHKLVQSWSGEFEVFATLRGVFSDYEKFGLFVRDRTIDRVEAECTEAVRRVVKEVKPEVIINGIGIVKQVPSSRDMIRTLQANSLFPHQLAKIAEQERARLITISTDCVFDGKRGNYTEQDPADAEDVYGKSKFLGEVTGGNCLTLRTSIIGRELATAHGLVEWFLSNTGGKVKGFTHAIYTGFPTIEIAEIIAGLIRDHRNLRGLYHLASEPISKFELLGLINKHFGCGVKIEPFEDFTIDRSLDSAKFRQETGFRPKDWETMVRNMAEDKTPYEDWRQ